MSRDYVFTSWSKPEPDFGGVKYICWGRELCPTTSKEHYQGYVSFNRTHRIPGAKRIIGSGDGSHLESRRGSRSEAREYCRKDGDFYEWGVFESLSNKDLFKCDIEFLKKEYPEFYCRYYRGLSQLKLDKGKMYREVNVKWLWGEPGCGKTRYVMEMDDVYKLDFPYKWWDGYEGESILLLDDLKNIDDLDRNYILNLLDGYRMRLETKGAHTWAKWTTVYITSNEKPYIRDKAMLRRITEIINVTSDGAV